LTSHVQNLFQEISPVNVFPAPGVRRGRPDPDPVIDSLGGCDLHEVLQQDHVVHHHLVRTFLLTLTFLRFELRFGLKKKYFSISTFKSD
jgi:hypothetical protein